MPVGWVGLPGGARGIVCLGLPALRCSQLTSGWRPPPPWRRGLELWRTLDAWGRRGHGRGTVRCRFAMAHSAIPVAITGWQTI